MKVAPIITLGVMLMISALPAQVHEGVPTVKADSQVPRFNSTEYMGYTQSPPTIDGTIGTTEWSAAEVYDIGVGSYNVKFYIMFDDTKIYMAVKAISDTTNDQKDRDPGYVASLDTDFIEITIDGEPDGRITYSSYTTPITMNGNCVDRGASANGGTNASLKYLAGWWIGSSSTGYSLYSCPPSAPGCGEVNQGTGEPYDYIATVFNSYRSYEYSIPYTGTGDELNKRIGGYINISLMVNDANGGSHRYIGRLPWNANPPRPPYQTFQLNDRPKPVISQLSKSYFYVGEQIQFDGSHSSDGLSTSLTYSWDFGDGPPPSSGEQVTHTYSEPGNYTVTLTVIDEYGGTAETSVDVEVVDRADPPVISDLDPATDPTISEGENITFSALVDDPDFSIGDGVEVLTVKWYVDDDLKKTKYIYSSDTLNYTFKTDYTSAGSYTIKLEVADSYNENGHLTSGPLSASVTWNLTVENTNRRPEIVSYTPSTLAVTTTEENAVLFSVEAEDPDGDSLTYRWYLDSKIQQGVTGAEFTYLETPDYTAQGKHTVAVIVSDGSKDNSVTWAVTVTNVNLPPIIKSTSPASDELTVDEGGELSFSVSAEDPDHTAITYTWYVNKEQVLRGKSKYTFETDYDSYSEDPYEIMVEVSDGGSSVYRYWNVTVNDVDRPPELYISEPYEGDIFTIADTITFDASDATDPDGDSMDYEWDLGDGTVKTSKTTKHRYSEPGEYKVTLSVTTHHMGREALYTTTVNITVRAAVVGVKEVTSDAPEGKIKEGTVITFTATVENTGDAEARNIEVVFVLDNSFELSKETISSLKAGASQDVDCVWTAVPGTHKVTAKVSKADVSIIGKGSSSSDEIVITEKATQGSGAGMGGMLPFILLAVVAVAVVFVAMAAYSRRSKKVGPEVQEAAAAAPVQQPYYPEPAPAPQPAAPAPPPQPAVEEAPAAVSPPPPGPEKKVFVEEVAVKTVPCPSCGRDMEEGASVCPFCGTVFEEEEEDMALRCPKCDAEIEEDWAICPECGHRLREAPEASPRCPNCGEEVEEDWAICPECGHKL